ncbi:MAG: S8 family serine peptidase [Chloroflexi bacterium]|nr:S8 family serine peptidase [Chloroflexota bacterium]
MTRTSVFLTRPIVLVVATAVAVASILGNEWTPRSLARENLGSDEVLTVIVELEDEPVAAYDGTKPNLRATRPRRGGKLKTSSPEALEYAAFLESKQREFGRALRQAIPEGRERRQFRTVLNGTVVILPKGRVEALKRLRGVKTVSTNETYRVSLDGSVPLINASAVWTAVGGTSAAGAGMRIAILDTGIDNSHPFLSDNALQPPAGFPMGVDGYTSNKVIVGKVYTPAGRTDTPADEYGHGTHVAGIAAGVYNYTTQSFRTVSGVAPKAFLMNYKVLLGPTGEGDTSEIVQAIEDAVADGADVVNMSFGGQSDQSIESDPLVAAVRNGTQAGVVFVAAAGNSGPGAQTVLSPAVSPEAIAAGNSTKGDAIATSSSRGPNLDISIKPDLTAPGTAIYSSVPFSAPWGFSDPQGFLSLSGTSMAAPHVSGAVALLRQLHPGWSPAQVKSALMNTARRSVFDSVSGSTARVMVQGAGRIDLQAAMNPGLTISPPAHSFGRGNVAPGGYYASRGFVVEEVAGSAGTWTTGVTQTATYPGLVAQVSPATVTVAASGSAGITLSISATGDVAPGDYEGYVTLTKGPTVLHIPYWVRLAYSYYFPFASKDGAELR